MTRHEAREQAFCILFERTFKPEEGIQEIVDNMADGWAPEVDEYAMTVSEQVWGALTDLDARIETLSRGWKKNRLPRITLTILRLAMYEMLFLPEIPLSVSINEAVEIAKKFATADDASFINGILATVAAELGESKRSGERVTKRSEDAAVSASAPAEEATEADPSANAPVSASAPAQEAPEEASEAVPAEDAPDSAMETTSAESSPKEASEAVPAAGAPASTPETAPPPSTGEETP